MNKKGFTLVEIIVVLVILAILAAIAIPYTLGYVEESKNSKDYLMAGNVLKAAQVVGTKYYALGDYYQGKAYESVSNVVNAPNREGEEGLRMKEVYNKIVNGNEDFTPFKAIYIINEGKVLSIRYKNLDRGIVYEWTTDQQQWKVVKKDDPAGDDRWATALIKDFELNDKRIWWNGYDPSNMPYTNDKYKLTTKTES